MGDIRVQYPRTGLCEDKGVGGSYRRQCRLVQHLGEDPCGGNGEWGPSAMPGPSSS